MKKLKLKETIAADAPSAQTAETNETPQSAVTATTIKLPDPERGDRLTTKRNDFRMASQQFPKGEVKEMAYGLVRWMVGESEEVVYNDLKDILSSKAMFFLKSLVDGQKERSHQYYQREVTKALREQTRTARLRHKK